MHIVCYNYFIPEKNIFCILSIMQCGKWFLFSYNLTTVVLYFDTQVYNFDVVLMT